MTVRLGAPHPTVQTITFLPNPQFTESEGSVNEVNFLRAEDNTPYSYVKSKGGRRRLSLRFVLSREKAFELRAFYEAYFASQVILTDHLGQVWVGFMALNPFELESTQATLGSAGGEMNHSAQFEFEGTKQ